MSCKLRFSIVMKESRDVRTRSVGHVENECRLLPGKLRLRISGELSQLKWRNALSQ